MTALAILSIALVVFVITLSILGAWGDFFFCLSTPFTRNALERYYRDKLMQKRFYDDDRFYEMATSEIVLLIKKDTHWKILCRTQKGNWFFVVLDVVFVPPLSFTIKPRCFATVEFEAKRWIMEEERFDLLEKYFGKIETA